MGYDTDFEGQFAVTPPLADNHRTYLAKFSETRRMKRNAEMTAGRPDPLREAVGLPVGIDGGYFVGAEGFAGQEQAQDIVNGNAAPSGQPGLWCQWVPTEDGTAIEWDGGEKFYDYVEWLEYLIEHFLKPWGYRLNGEVKWQGEDMDDRGLLTVTDTEVATTELL